MDAVGRVQAPGWPVASVLNSPVKDRLASIVAVWNALGLNNPIVPALEILV